MHVCKKYQIMQFYSFPKGNNDFENLAYCVDVGKTKKKINVNFLKFNVSAAVARNKINTGLFFVILHDKFHCG